MVNDPMDVGQPDSIEVEEGADGLALVRRWFSPLIVFLTVFALFWNGVLMARFFIIRKTDASPIVKLFPLFHVAVGIGLTYYVIAGYVNRTTIRLLGHTLTIRHSRGDPKWSQLQADRRTEVE